MGGYFWLPCPLCSEPFGGNEWVGRISLPAGENRSQGICPACELDLGAQAAAICRTEGHTPIASSGKLNPTTSTRDTEGQVTATFTFDLSSLTEHYCSTCGIDLTEEDTRG